MRMYQKAAFIISMLIAFASCVKEEYRLDENLAVPGLSPSLAIPIASTDFALGDIIQPLGLQDNVLLDDDVEMAMIFKERLFEIGLEDLVVLPVQEIEESYKADALTAALFNANLAGAELPIPLEFNFPFEFENGEQIDSIRLGESFLEVNLTSSFRHDMDVHLTIPELSNEDGIFSYQFTLDYMGDLPVESEVQIDVSNHLLDFTTPGNDNEINIQTEFVVTHSGEFTSVNDSVHFQFSLSSNSLKSAYGYLGQYNGIAEIDTQRVDVFEDIDAESIRFADPAIELDFYNSSGIPMEIDFTSLFAPENSINQLITGGALEDIPVINPAPNPGAQALTEHRVDNSNTDPDLSDMLSEGPVDLIYTAAGLTNPDGFASNFILDTSVVACDATVILPLYGAIEGYTFMDTLLVDMESDLGLSEDGGLTIEDIKSVQLRIIADNGLPIETSLQVVFLDSLYAPTDSLFLSQGEVPFLRSGIVDHNLPESHPEHGKVIAPSRTVTDVFMTPTRLEEIIGGEVKYLIIRIVGSSSQAVADELVRFYSEDFLRVQLSAKIETEIDISG